MSNRRFKTTIAYDGRPFAGWQCQPGGNTIQDHLEAAARAIHPEVSGFHGSGRTDAGVHALAQIAHFDAPESFRMDAGAWQRALNTKLPRTIRVMNCEEAAPDFHARFCATGKTYRYDVFTGAVLPPLSAGLVWHLRKGLDPDLLAEVLRLFEGEHDFASFAANRGDPKSNPEDTWRRIDRATVEELPGDVLRLTFQGSGFLYKMVRLLVGGAVRCSQGGIPIQEIQELLDHPRSGKKSPLAAPPDGLYLVSVNYEANDSWCP